jgi:hypothetical protein
MATIGGTTPFVLLLFLEASRGTLVPFRPIQAPLLANEVCPFVVRIVKRASANRGIPPASASPNTLTPLKTPPACCSNECHHLIVPPWKTRQ